MVDAEKLPIFPEEADGENAYKLARISAALGDLALPLLGQSMQVLMDRYVGAPLEARRIKWFKLVAVKLEELAARPNGFDIHSLVDNEEFVTTVLDTTKAALRTHLDEKREALANAVANTAAGYRLNEVLRAAFISHVDEFSPFHLKVLRALHDYDHNDNFAWSALEHLKKAERRGRFNNPIPLSLDDETFATVIADLLRARLVHPKIDLPVVAPFFSGMPLNVRKTTETGSEFLRFISRPLSQA